MVRDVINHTYKAIKTWINNPAYRARMIVPELGHFEFNALAITRELEKLVWALRKYKDNEEIYGVFKEYFKVLWEMKQIQNRYDRRMKIKYNPSLALKSRRNYAIAKKGEDLTLLPDPFWYKNQDKE